MDTTKTILAIWAVGLVGCLIMKKYSLKTSSCMRYMYLLFAYYLQFFDVVLYLRYELRRNKNVK